MRRTTTRATATRATATGARLAAGAAALALLVSGCGGGTSVGGDAEDEESPAAQATGPVEGSIRLSWWGAETRNAKTNAVADMFEEANPGVTVERETADFGAYWDRLNVQAAGNNMPCVTQTQARQLNDFTKRDVLMDLQPLVDDGVIDTTDIPDEVLDAGRGPDGGLYMLPYGAAYDALMVNETLAEQAGVGLPEEGYTFPELMDWAREAQPGLPEGVRALNLGGGLPNYLIGYVQANGEEMFEEGQVGFPKEMLVEYWTMWEEARQDGITVDAAARAEEPTQPEESYIAQGRVMADNRPGNALTPAQGTLEGQGTGQQLTTLPLPSGPEGSGNVLISSGFSIPKSCDNVPTAAAFISFWLQDDEAAAQFASDNGAVVNQRHLQQQLEDPELPELKKRELELFQQIVENDPPAVVYPAGYQAVFESAYTRAYENVSFGRATVEEAVDAFFEEANAGLS